MKNTFIKNTNPYTDPWDFDSIDVMKAPGEIKKASEITETTYEPEMIVEDLLAKSQTMLVSGAAKVGKSFFVADLAVSVASGTEWLGRKCSKGKVLYIELENGEFETAKRLKHMVSQKGIDESVLNDIYIFSLTKGFVRFTNEFFDRIRDMVKNPFFDLIIIDPIYMLLEGDEKQFGSNQKLFKRNRLF